MLTHFVKMLKHFDEVCTRSLVGLRLPAACSCKESFLQSKKRPRPAGKPGGDDFSLPTANYCSQRMNFDIV